MLAIENKLRQTYNLNVPRAVVHDAMYMVNSEALTRRQSGRRKKKEKGHFVSQGPDWVYSFDGHDKLMGYQNHRRNLIPMKFFIFSRPRNFLSENLNVLICIVKFFMRKMRFFVLLFSKYLGL